MPEAKKKTPAKPKAQAKPKVQVDRQKPKDDDEVMAESIKKTEEETTSEPYVPKRQPLKAAGLDQHAEEAKRQAELAEERRIHNERTAGISSS